MPYELGLASAVKISSRYQYEIFVLEAKDFRLDLTLSDYKGRDPLIHHGTCDGMIACLLDTFASDVDAQQKLEGTFDLAEGSHTLTLNVDASTWFTKGTACLDPAIPSNLSDINNNIQNSLKAFRDDDRDGHDDHR